MNRSAALLLGAHHVPLHRGPQHPSYATEGWVRNVGKDVDEIGKNEKIKRKRSQYLLADIRSN